MYAFGFNMLCNERVLVLVLIFLFCLNPIINFHVCNLHRYEMRLCNQSTEQMVWYQV